MGIDRRNFIKVAAIGTALGHFSLTLSQTKAYAGTTRIKPGRLVTSICPFCDVGCGVTATVAGGKIVGVEGDPEHPISQGALCPRGTALYQVANSDRRLTSVKYRRPGASTWEVKSWEWAVAKIAANIKNTRDESFAAVDSQDRLVNRCEGIACLGGAALSNEEYFAYSKLARALGVVSVEHHALDPGASSAAGLASSAGLGMMTQPWTDASNSSCILIIGADVAQSHPVAIKWLEGAKEQGAELILVDQRRTRTAAIADFFLPIRSGTEIALTGAIINYALENNLVRRDYLAAHTNASYLLDPSFDSSDGVFGELVDGEYTKEHWGFQTDAFGNPRKDLSLADPNCVFQKLKTHFARYTPEKASEITGAPESEIRSIARTVCATHVPNKAAAIMYGVASRQLNRSSQTARAYLILQHLLGNLGVAGGGLYPLYAGMSSQGALDHGLLRDRLPGYLKCPSATDSSLRLYLDKWTAAAAHPASPVWWKNYSNCAVSLLKAYWGDFATPENEFAYHFLPKLDPEETQASLLARIAVGEIKGLVVLGQNPAAGPLTEFERQTLAKLDWLVVADMWDPTQPAIANRNGNLDSEFLAELSVNTEVLLLPAAASVEKEGSITNAARWCQWCNAATSPPGQARDFLSILTDLQRQLKRLYAAGGICPDPVAYLSWTHGSDVHAVAKEINGYFTRNVVLPDKAESFKKGDLVPSADYLRSDGSTSSGNWLYCASYTEAGNKPARREASRADNDPCGLQPGWSYSWPGNQRILYNRAGCNARGQPWDSQHPVVTFDRRTRSWLGDVPDGKAPPQLRADGSSDPGGVDLNELLTEGQTNIFAGGLADGPFPEYYEPIESPVANALSPQQSNPILRHKYQTQIGSAHQYPIVATVIGVPAHWQEAGLVRNLPWLAELSRGPSVELSEELAREKGISNNDLVTITTARAPLGFSLRAQVTKRLKPCQIAGATVHEVVLTWPFGWTGYAAVLGADYQASDFVPAFGLLPEFAVCLCNMRKEDQKW